MKKTTVVAYRADGRACLEIFDGEKVKLYPLEEHEARRIAAQLVAATVDDEKVQEGAELVRKGTDFFAQLKRIAGR